MRQAILAGVVALVPLSAGAEVKSATPESMLIEHRFTIAAPAARVWEMLLHPERWWPPDHSWSGKRENFSIDPVAGGCFCERWDGNEVEHARVVMLMPNKLLRFDAALGPLQELAISGVINVALAVIGIHGPGWLTNPSLALISVAMVDVWKGVGLATLIYIAGLATISPDYYEAARIDGATRRQMFWRITVPLVRPATITVITLSLIGGMRSFDVIWAMTKGGPGFSSDVIASVIYKQYQAGFFGLSTAGNVILFLLIALIMMPFTFWFNRREVEL